MNKQEFLSTLQGRLGWLPRHELDTSLAFYTEAIDDRIEDGASEEDAVAALGSIEEIVARIVEEVPPIPKTVAQFKTPSTTANILLAVLLSPIWIPLAFGGIVAVLSIYIALWALAASFWIIVGIFIIMVPISLYGLFYCAAQGFFLSGVAVAGVGFLFGGVGLILTPAASLIGKGLVRLASLFARSIKSLFIREARAEPVQKEHPNSLPRDPRQTTTSELSSKGAN